MPAGRRLVGFTDMHLEILRLLADGLYAKEIGARMNYSQWTVRQHIQDMRTTLGAKNNPHLMSISMKRGLIH